MLIYLTYIPGTMNMGVSRVTDKFQVTIPKDVRESVGLRPGEEVTVEGAPGGAIIVNRFEIVKDPLTMLIGKRPLFPETPQLQEAGGAIRRTVETDCGVFSR